MPEGIQRVVVTGMGAVSPIGTGIDRFWNAAKEGCSGSQIIEDLAIGDHKRIGCPVNDFSATDYLDRKTARRTSRFIQFAIASAQMAKEQAGYEIDDPHQIGVYIGTGAGGYDELDKEYPNFIEHGRRGVSPFAITNIIPNMAAGNVSIHLGVKGPCVAPVAACAAGLYAVSDAWYAIRHGRIDAAFAGGSESTMTSFVFTGYEKIRAISSRFDEPEAACRPFDKDRDGFVMGEGSAVLFMESYESAKKRGANILAEIVACNTTCDAAHITSPDTTGETIARTMSDAVKIGEINPEDVDYIHAHGTSTRLNDKVESGAIRQVFKNGHQPAVTGLKSMIGHTLGASGALALVTAVKSMQDQVVPPTINTETIDDECAPIDLVQREAREQNINYILTNAFGFGGHNGCVLLKRV